MRLLRNVTAVCEPTRKEYLLNLVFTDIQNTSIRILQCVTDHKVILVTLPCTAVLEAPFERGVWQHLAAANWKVLEEELRATEYCATAQPRTLLLIFNKWCGIT